MEKNKGFWIIGIYIVLAVYMLPMFPHGGSANELTRWATAASLVERSSFDISWTKDLIGPNVDTAKVGDATYSNKPPGTALLSAPIYAIVRVFVGPPDESNIRITWFAMRFFLSTLPLLLLAGWLYSRDTDEYSLAVLLFASPMFVYSILFFSHVLVGVLIYVAFRLIFDSRRIFLRSCFLAGAICGFAVISEFPAIIPISVIGIGLLFTHRQDRVRNLLFFIAGGLPFAAILLTYNYSLFGSPFALSYGYESVPAWAEVAEQGLYGIGFPSFSNLYLILFSPSRGLFFIAPVLLFSVVAFLSSRESKTLRHRIKVAMILVTFIVISGHGAAHGGWAIGPRYLLLIIPLMLDSFFDGEVYEFSNIWQGLLFSVSFVLCTLPLLTFPFAPPEFKYPHNSFWTKFLYEEQWFTPNLANAVGLPSGIWTLIPVVVMLFVVFYVVWRYARRPLRFFAGAFAGLIAVTVYITLPNLDSAENRFRRATIAERFFKPAERLESFRPEVPPDRIRDYLWTIADTRAFAPNNFPYLETRDREQSPTAEIERAIAIHTAGKTEEAIIVLSNGRERFPFAACEFGTKIAAIYYGSGQKELARTELEAVQKFVDQRSRPDCVRSQFMLGSLYRENGETAAADDAFKRFLANSVESTDSQIRGFRKSLGVK